MLIEFSVENFRSFAGEQVLSMNAGRFRSQRVGSVINSEFNGAPHTLRSLAVMGSNGSGKSSLIRAIWLLQELVENSAQKMQKGDKLPVTPQKLDSSLRDNPSKFQIIFSHNSVVYTYAFSATSEYFVHECLHEKRRGAPIKEVFSRSRREDGKYDWNLGTLPAENARVWRDSTRLNALFLSTAVQLNSDELALPFEWLTDSLRIIWGDVPFSPSLTSHLIKDHVDDGCRSAILNIVREADLGIKNIVVHERQFDENLVPTDAPEEMRRRMIQELKDSTFYEPEFLHRDRQGDTVTFEFEDESDGTQKLYSLAGPIVTSLRHNVTLIVDELDTSLHPLLLRLIVSLFQNPENDLSTSQLIFSTHDAGLLDSNILERDQFVFAEKRRGATELIPLIDYRPRKGEAIRDNYLRGRYGGIPAISRVKGT